MRFPRETHRKGKRSRREPRKTLICTVYIIHVYMRDKSVFYKCKRVIIFCGTTMCELSAYRINTFLRNRRRTHTTKGNTTNVHDTRKITVSLFISILIIFKNIGINAFV